MEILARLAKEKGKTVVLSIHQVLVHTKRMHAPITQRGDMILLDGCTAILQS